MALPSRLDDLRRNDLLSICSSLIAHFEDNHRACIEDWESFCDRVELHSRRLAGSD